MVHIGNFGTCTGVLVAPKVVLTNRHCVENVVNEPYAPLRSSIVITVPGSAPGKFDGKFSFVTALMAISPVEFSIGGLKPDYAFLSLLEEMEGFKGAKLNFNGIVAGETYHIFGVSPYRDAKDKSAVERRECKAVYNTTFAPFLDAPRDPMLMFAHCLIGPSNSGSPIYNDKDELVGIIGGQLAPPTVDVLNSLASTFFKITDETTVLGHIGWGTNLACMPDINDLGKSIHADCNRDFVQLPKPALFPEKVRNQAETELKNLPLTDETFHYAVERANEMDQIVKLVSQAVFLRVPDCIYPSALGNAKSPLDLDVSFSGAKLSPHWELTSEAAGLRSEKFTLTYDVEALKSKGTAELTIGLGKNIRFHKTQLKVCDGK